GGFLFALATGSRLYERFEERDQVVARRRRVVDLRLIVVVERQDRRARVVTARQLGGTEFLSGRGFVYRHRIGSGLEVHLVIGVTTVVLVPGAFFERLFVFHLGASDGIDLGVRIGVSVELNHPVPRQSGGVLDELTAVRGEQHHFVRRRARVVCAFTRHGGALTHTTEVVGEEFGRQLGRWRVDRCRPILRDMDGRSAGAHRHYGDDGTRLSVHR